MARYVVEEQGLNMKAKTEFGETPLHKASEKWLGCVAAKSKNGSDKNAPE